MLDYCFSFLFQHLMWRQQCSILVEFGNSKYLCIDFIDFLIKKVQVMVVNVIKNEKKINDDKIQYLDYKPDEVEKGFYLFFMIENLLKKLKTLDLLKEDSSNDTVRSKTKITNVVDLWRTNWLRRDATISEPPKHNDKVKLMKWKDILENMIIDCSQDFPFIACYVWNCLELLNLCLGS